MGLAGGGLRIRGAPVATIGCGIGGDAGEGRATEGVLEGAEDGGELDLWGVVLAVKGPGAVVVGVPAVWLGRGGGGVFAGVGVGCGGGGGGHSSLGEAKVGLGTVRKRKMSRGGEWMRVTHQMAGERSSTRGKACFGSALWGR